MERIIIGFVLGAVLGSFIDCIANRSVTKESFWGRSHCDHCKKPLRWYQLIPIISYFVYQGKCPHCHKKFSIESTLVEIVSGLLTAMLFFLFVPENILFLPWTAQLITALEVLLKQFAIGVFLAVFITDMKTGLIPDRITYPSALIAFILILVLTALKIGFMYFSLQQSPLGKYLLPPESDYFYRHAFIIAWPLILSVISAIGVGLFFLTLILLTRGRGMGGGDMKLGVFIGLIFGTPTYATGMPQSIVVIMLSFLMGSVFGIALLLLKFKKFGQTIPFGPFLSLASLLVLFWGESIAEWYFNIRLF